MKWEKDHNSTPTRCHSCPNFFYPKSWCRPKLKSESSYWSTHVLPQYWALRHLSCQTLVFVDAIPLNLNRRYFREKMQAEAGTSLAHNPWYISLWSWSICAYATRSNPFPIFNLFRTVQISFNLNWMDSERAVGNKRRRYRGVPNALSSRYITPSSNWWCNDPVDCSS